MDINFHGCGVCPLKTVREKAFSCTSVQIERVGIRLRSYVAYRLDGNSYLPSEFFYMHFFTF